MIEASDTLETLSISAARAAVAGGRSSAVALASAHFERIAAQDGELGCFLALSRERAIAQAERVDADARAGKELGPLAGVPVAVKDVLATKGIGVENPSRMASAI